MSNSAAQPSGIRVERDRFVAFAFASADALFEVDSNYEIQFAAGAIQALLGSHPDELIGTSFVTHIASRDQGRLRAQMAAISPGKRMPRSSVSLHRADGDSIRVAVAGYRIPEDEDTIYMTFCVVRQLVSAKESRDEETGLLGPRSFRKITEARIREAQATGEDYSLTLLGLKGIDEMCGRIDGEASGSLMARIGESLRDVALDGDIAGRFDKNTFGVIHGKSVDLDGVTAAIKAFARDVDPEHRGINIAVARVKIDPRWVDPGDAAKAVLHTVTKFSQREIDGFAIDGSSGGYQTMVRETLEEMSRIREIIEKRVFKLALQPVVNLQTRKTHHYECLVRFPDSEQGASPFDRIEFAEDLGIIRDLDLAVVGRTIEIVQRVESTGDKGVTLARQGDVPCSVEKGEAGMVGLRG